MIWSKPGLADRPQRTWLSLGHFQSSGRGAMLLRRRACRTEAWGLGKETHVHGSKYISSLSNYFMKESREGKAENSQMVDG